jgi:hypothetical protein
MTSGRDIMGIFRQKRPFSKVFDGLEARMQTFVV